MGKSTISMAIFNSYVKLPEGRYHWYSWTLIRIILMNVDDIFQGKTKKGTTPILDSEPAQVFPEPSPTLEVL